MIHYTYYIVARFCDQFRADVSWSVIAREGSEVSSIYSRSFMSKAFMVLWIDDGVYRSIKSLYIDDVKVECKNTWWVDSDLVFDWIAFLSGLANIPSIDLKLSIYFRVVLILSTFTFYHILSTLEPVKTKYKGTSLIQTLFFQNIQLSPIKLDNSVMRTVSWKQKCLDKWVSTACIDYLRYWSKMAKKKIVEI